VKALLNCAPSTWPGTSTPGFDPLMTTLVDRPFVQHVVEWLVQAGFDRIDVLVDGPNPALAQLLGDGTRWGVRLRMRRIPAGAGLPLRSLAEETGLETGLLLARGGCLPAVDLAACRPAPRAENPTTIFAPGADGSAAEWTGWAWLTRHSLKGTDRLASPAAWQRRMQTWAAARACQLVAPRVLSAGTPRALLAAQRAVLGGEVRGLHIDAREVGSGVWLARGASLSPDAIVHAPVYVGPFASVRAAELGPFAVVEAGAIVSGDTTVTNATVGARTYVGPHVELDNVVVRGQVLCHPELVESVRVNDESWLQDLAAVPLPA